MDSVIDCWSENSPSAWPWSMAVCSADVRSSTLVGRKASRHVVQAARWAAVGIEAQRPPVIGMQAGLPATPHETPAWFMPLPPQAIQLPRLAEAPVPNTTTKEITDDAGSVATMRS